MNVEQLLSQRKLETFTVEGSAPNVVSADNQAWLALESVLLTDPVAAWSLKGMQHVYDAKNGVVKGVQFKAEFVRTPDDE